MTISRKSRRVNPIVPGLTALAICLLIVAVVWAVRGRTGSPSSAPPDAQRQWVSQQVQQMIAGLDVLTVSHYTADTVQEGQVRLPGEYQAARQNLQQLDQVFKDIRPYLESQQAVELEDALMTLQALVADKQPAATVKAQAEALSGMLRQVR